MNRLVALIFLVASLPVPADSTRTRLGEFFDDANTIRARFVQEVLDEKGDLLQVSTGSLEISRPGRFRWHYDSPNDQLIVADGKNVWVYDPELEQATVKPIEEALMAGPMRLLTGLEPLEGEFTVSEAEPREGMEWVELVPKSGETGFQRVFFGLDKSGVQRMDFYDHFGQKTVITFKDLETNVRISSRRFRFDVPDNVDLIGKPL